MTKGDLNRSRSGIARAEENDPMRPYNFRSTRDRRARDVTPLYQFLCAVGGALIVFILTFAILLWYYHKPRNRRFVKVSTVRLSRPDRKKRRCSSLRRFTIWFLSFKDNEPQSFAFCQCLTRNTSTS